MEKIKKNINEINERISKGSLKSERSSDKVTLIAVTKTRSTEEINKAIEAGITDIGENKVQEIINKYDKVLPVRWHMIGHLQTNKVKYIIDKVKMIHSVDSIRLAKEINKRAIQNNLVMDILVQVNIADEESKFGLKPKSLESFLNDLEEYKNINMKGFMMVAPFAEHAEEVRIHFRQMKQLFDTYKRSKCFENMVYLSMGMTNDFEIAVEEGANMVRIGTAIFGAR